MTSLEERWPGPHGIAAGLVRRYEEPHRRYHTVTHLTEVLDHVDELAGEAADADAVRLAAWFHDAVYTPMSGDNEEHSAVLAEQLLTRAGVDAGTVAEVARLVRLTASHEAVPGDRNAAVLCDADLAILAAGPERYAAYAAAVREEYAEVEEDVFRRGRAAVLRNLLALPSLYGTTPARERWETAARHNLETELTLLDPR